MQVLKEDKTCKTCAVYEAELESQRAEKEYYRDLLLKRLGAIGEESTPISPEDYQPVHRSVSFSRIRQELEKNSRAKAREGNKVDLTLVEPASRSELTEAERVFEDSLKASK